jgi:Tol biopolymer transport system component
VPVLDAVTVKVSGAANIDVSANGRLVYTAGGTTLALRTLAWVDRTGRETPIPAPPRNYYYTRVSPDGRRVSLDVRDQEEDIWIWDVTRETMSRLTDKAGADQYGLWAGNDRVVFASMMTGRNELFFHRPDGVGQPEQITDTKAGDLVPFPNAVTPDGRQVIFRAAVDGQNDLFVADIGSDRTFRKLLSTQHDERNASVSPDGRFMVFESDLSGQLEIYVRPFPDVDTRQWPVSTAGGGEPLWAASGREIIYVSTDGWLMSVPVLGYQPELTLGKPARLFEVKKYFFGGQGRNYDMTRDGTRFTMVKPDATQAAPDLPITVVLNWADELRARLK